MVKPKYQAKRYLEIVMGGSSIEIEVALEYTVHPYVPAKGPSYASGGQPAEGGCVDEVWFKGAKWTGKPSADALPPDIPEWLEDWIVAEVESDGLYDEAMEFELGAREYAEDMRDQERRENAR